MIKKRLFTQHFDPKVAHIAFFAKREIEPGEELTYLRTDEEPSRTSEFNCSCKHKDCSGFL